VNDYDALRDYLKQQKLPEFVLGFEQIEEIIDLLGKKEKKDEDLLREMQLSEKQAKVLYNEAAGVIRTLVDLKDLLKKKEHSDETQGLIRRKVEDTKRWNKFIDSVEKGEAV